MSLNKQNLAKAQLQVLQAKIGQRRTGGAGPRQPETTGRTTGLYHDRVANRWIVLSRDVEIGDAVSSILVLGSSATLVMTLGDTSECTSKGKVDESDIGKFIWDNRRGSKLSRSRTDVSGKVTKISPMGGRKITSPRSKCASRSIIQKRAQAMMTANAEIILEEHKNVLQIPEGSIIYDKDKKASVEVPDPKLKKARKRSRSTSGFEWGEDRVLQGLKEGDRSYCSRMG